MFLLWLGLVTWLAITHVFWRDEVRAFSLALSGSNIIEMLRNIHGEGHPALWYVFLRTAHELFPRREALPLVAAVIGIAAMALITFRSPFRPLIIALVLFSAWGAFEYVVVARNYGISALAMFSLAALYPRIKDTPWLGLFLALLCNTNVPSCFLAAALLLFRFVELLISPSRGNRRTWLIFGVNALLSAVGAILCFLTVYPTVNDAAVSPHLRTWNAGSILSGLMDAHSGFTALPFYGGGTAATILLLLSCLAFVRSPAAFVAALAGWCGLKLFFYFIYPSYYRHEVLYLVFLLSLLWIVAKTTDAGIRGRPWLNAVQTLGTAIFVLLLAIQVRALVHIVHTQQEGIPYSHSRDVAMLLRTPKLSHAIVMADPDAMLESLPYYTNNPLWFIRQRRFGQVVRFTRDARREITPDDILSDAQLLHERYGRPVVFLDYLDLEPGRHRVMYDDSTTVTRESERHFQSETRLLGRLKGSVEGEDYDVYLYPR